MMNIAILQHVAFESAGMIADWAELRGHTMTIYKLYENPSLPILDMFDMLVIMGGSMSVGDETQYPWLIAEKNLIRLAIEADKYILGVCLGAQLIASVLGAKVYPNHAKEIGWFPVAIVDEAMGHPLCSDLNSAMNVFHWHGDMFDVPDHAELLMSSENCKHQAFIYHQRVLGLQFHLEMTEAGIKNILMHCKEDIIPSTTIQSEDEILSHIAAIIPCRRALNSILDKLTGFA